jgi:CRP-like cAMP-binding protein
MNSSTEPKPGSETEGEPQSSCELTSNLEVLRGVDLFSSLPLERLKLLAYLSRRDSYEQGKFLFRQGDPDDKGYLILEGKVQVLREYEDHSVILSEMGQGTFFGGLALLAEIDRLFSVKASEPLYCLTVDRESFQKILLQFPEMAIKVLNVMIQRITKFEDKLLRSHVHRCVYDPQRHG